MVDKKEEKLLGTRHEPCGKRRPGLVREARRLGFNAREIERLREVYDKRYRKRMRLVQEKVPEGN